MSSLLAPNQLAGKAQGQTFKFTDVIPGRLERQWRLAQETLESKVSASAPTSPGMPSPKCRDLTLHGHSTHRSPLFSILFKSFPPGLGSPALLW